MVTLSISTHDLYEGLSNQRHPGWWMKALPIDASWRFGFLFGPSVFYLPSPLTFPSLPPSFSPSLPPSLSPLFLSLLCLCLVPVKGSQSLGTSVTDGYYHYAGAGQHILVLSERSKCSETLSCFSSPHSQVFYCNPM